MMEWITALVDFILHIDVHLASITASYGVWAYVVLALIVFAETGLVVTPFLPGDSLLFAAGAICALGTLNVWILIGLLIVAAIAGDAVNYSMGGTLATSYCVAGCNDSSSGNISTRRMRFTNSMAERPSFWLDSCPLCGRLRRSWRVLAR